MYEYDPFYQTKEDANTMYIDRKWWNLQCNYAKQLITSRIHNIELTDIEIPHENWIKQCGDTVLLKQMYFSNLEAYDYNVWYNENIENGPKNVFIIDIDADDKEILKKIFDSQTTALEKKTYGIENLLNLKQKIQNCIDKNEILGKSLHNCGIFARLSGTSGKNEIRLKPLHSIEQILNFLTKNILFLKQEYKKDKITKLVVMPWNNNLDDRYEFRIFVYNGKLTGISQQKWFQLYQYSKEELDLITSAMKNLEFIKDVPYNTFVGDVWIDIKESNCGGDDLKSESKCILIECNPFGAHCGAGSSLFEWTKDYNQLYGNNGNVCEFRYLSILKDI